MKKYIRRLILAVCILLMIIVALGSVRVYMFNRHDWHLPKEKHILFMGASHIYHAVNDSLMLSAVNWAASSERYMYTYIKLQHLLPANPQIDTIFLQLAPTDLWEDTDYKYHVLNEQSNFVKLYWPYFSKEQWDIFKNEPIQVGNLVLSTLASVKNLRQETWWKAMGGFSPAQSVMKREDVTPNPVVSQGYGHTVNYNYLRRIITICKKHKITLLFIYCPVYHPEYYYDQKYFYRAYRENFSDIPLFDYSHWPLASNEYKDAHHVNFRGAHKFTEELKRRFGIK